MIKILSYDASEILFEFDDTDVRKMYRYIETQDYKTSDEYELILQLKKIETEER